MNSKFVVNKFNSYLYSDLGVRDNFLNLCAYSSAMVLYCDEEVCVSSLKETSRILVRRDYSLWKEYSLMNRLFCYYFTAMDKLRLNISKITDSEYSIDCRNAVSKCIASVLSVIDLYMKHKSNSVCAFSMSECVQDRVPVLRDVLLKDMDIDIGAVSLLPTDTYSELGGLEFRIRLNIYDSDKNESERELLYSNRIDISKKKDLYLIPRIGVLGILANSGYLDYYSQKPFFSTADTVYLSIKGGKTGG